MTLDEIRKWYCHNPRTHEDAPCRTCMIGKLLDELDAIKVDLLLFKREAAAYAKDYSDAIKRIDSLPAKCTCGHKTAYPVAGCRVCVNCGSFSWVATRGF